MSGHESAALTATWSKVSNCTGYSFDQYKLCFNKQVSDGNGATFPSVPSSPSAAFGCYPVSNNMATESATVFVHRSYQDWTARLFACDNYSCSDWYGLNTANGEVLVDDSDTEETKPEIWVLEDIDDYDTDTDRVVAEDNASASAALFYPNGFPSEGYLGLWWSVDEDHFNLPSRIEQKVASNSGWQNFNTTSWGSTQTVAQEPAIDPAGTFENPTHPWVLAMKDGLDYYIQMFFHLGPQGQYEVWRIESHDEDGQDFGLDCTDTGGCAVGADECGYGEPCNWETPDTGEAAEVVVCSDTGDAACFYIASAGHGRVAHDYVAYGAATPTDEPFMLFTGNTHTQTSADDPERCSIGGTTADLYQLTYDASGELWSMPLDTGTACPDGVVMEDVHDPGVIPLPNGAFRVYYQVNLDSFEVAFWNGTSLEEGVPLLIAFDDTSTYGITAGGLYGSGNRPDLGACLENIDTLVFPDPPTVHEGAFFKAGITGYDNSDPTDDCFVDGGIVFAEHRN